ncbi:uncharacterized protein LOC118421236 [Branchiostoma floridae]|uniref:Uncharacterized protein LOC118421236 n=1 Tax=Branchiostoma floridae TaxID=7739 RepID=A0A9J7LK03_BRAFL|nr:uncharacterized protein LOC118421236 [Branchiostoma floridae]
MAVRILTLTWAVLVVVVPWTTCTAADDRPSSGEMYVAQVHARVRRAACDPFIDPNCNTEISLNRECYSCDMSTDPECYKFRSRQTSGKAQCDPGEYCWVTNRFDLQRNVWTFYSRGCEDRTCAQWQKWDCQTTNNIRECSFCCREDRCNGFWGIANGAVQTAGVRGLFGVVLAMMSALYALL